MSLLHEPNHRIVLAGNAHQGSCLLEPLAEDEHQGTHQAAAMAEGLDHSTNSRAQVKRLRGQRTQLGVIG